jgi:hypothetical protein
MHCCLLLTSLKVAVVVQNGAWARTIGRRYGQRLRGSSHAGEAAALARSGARSHHDGFMTGSSHTIAMQLK